ncbi:MAG: LAGLIDADG family homing endonuclease [Chloroherpetonaceae bacterium]|nr:LAGLIDADG family homing endonuclease [Chloroherpetonaceae bacterium]
MELQTEWVVGFTDGEGCFFVGIQKSEKTTLGYQVIPEFRIVQHKRDIAVLYALKRFFGCGKVCPNHDDRYEFRVRKLEHLAQIVAFFEKHSLKTKKKVDFLKFRDIIRLMQEKKHLEPEGLRKIAKIASEMNTGKRQALQALLDKNPESG